jgi:hypothetical protein
MDIDAWIAQQDDQERSRYTLGGAGDNGSILVADSDTYDDFPPGTTGASPMNTLAVTPSVSLTGMVPGSLTLEFDNSFRPESPTDNQVGQVDVSYDGGTTWINLLNMTGQNTSNQPPFPRINEHVTLNANNPAGAASAQFRFAYRGGNNNWWWAIDNVAIKSNQTVTPPLTVTGNTQPRNGSATVNANGSFSYNPTAGFNGLDSFTYTASDGTLTKTETVYVLVGSPPIGFQVNDGSAQRSMVQSLTVAINGLATFATTPGAAFQLTGPGGNVGLVGTSRYINNSTLVNLTFTGAGIVNGSLADGRYVLTAFGNQITVNGAALDADGDGTAGGNFVFGDDVNNERLFRLFGDATGNGTTDLLDLTVFRSTFNKTAAEAGFLAFLDYDANQTVDLIDLGEFRGRFNVNLYP